MPNIFGASLTNLLSQGGQFLAGRNQQQALNAEAAAKQKAALEQALLERQKTDASIAYQKALTQSVLNPQKHEGVRVDLDNGNIGLLDQVSGEVIDTGKKAYREPKAPQAPVLGSPEWLKAQADLEKIRHQYDTTPGTGGAGGAGSSAAERMNSKLGEAAAGANQILGQVDSALTSPVAAVAARPGAMSGLANMFTSDEQQRAATAALNFINPAVRYLSGAQMNEQEAKRYYDALIPRIGDNPSTVELKRQMRQALIDAMGSGQWQGAPNPDGTPNTANVDAFINSFQQGTPSGADSLRAKFQARLNGGQ